LPAVTQKPACYSEASLVSQRLPARTVQVWSLEAVLHKFILAISGLL